MDLPDGKPRQLSAASAREFHPSWSPDGKWLAYVSWSPEGGHIWKRPGDGSGEPTAAHARRRVLSRPGLVARRQADRGAPGTAARARREPDGLRATAGLDLVWVPADGGDATLISPARGASRPHFADDPDRIYVTTPKGLVSMRFDGTDRRTHLSVVGKTALFAERARAAPRRSCSAPTADGRWPASTNQLYLLALPALRRRGAQGLRPRADRAAQEAHRRRRRLRRLGRRRQDDHLGRRLERLPPAVRFGRLRPLKAEGRRRAKDEEKAAKAEKERRSPSPRRSPSWSSGPRHRPRGTIVLRGAKVVTMRGDEVIAERRHRRHRQPDRGRRAQGLGQGARGGQGHRRRRDDDRARLRRHPRPLDGDPPRRCSTCRTGASSPTSPTA